MAPVPSPSLLFVYGTLRPAYLRLPQPARRMRPPHILHAHAAWRGAAVLRGHALWDLGDYPGVRPAPGGVVVGDVFDVRALGEKMALLDGYEGMGDQFDRPWEYRREIVEVEISGVDGREDAVCVAWVYIYNWDIDDKVTVLVSDGDYVKHAARNL